LVIAIRLRVSRRFTGSASLNSSSAVTSPIASTGTVRSRQKRQVRSNIVRINLVDPTRLSLDPETGIEQVCGSDARLTGESKRFSEGRLDTGERVHGGHVEQPRLEHPGQADIRPGA